MFLYSLKRRIFHILVVVVLILGLLPLYAFADSNESQSGVEVEATATAQIETVKDVGVTTATATNSSASTSTKSSSATTEATSVTATTAQEDENVVAVENETLKIQLDITHMQSGDADVNVMLQKKSGTTWNDVQKVTLRAGYATEIADLAEGTYRVQLIDEYYEHVNGTQAQLDENVSVVSDEGTTKVKTVDGFAFTPETATTVHVVLDDVVKEETSTATSTESTTAEKATTETTTENTTNDESTNNKSSKDLENGILGNDGSELLDEYGNYSDTDKDTLCSIHLRAVGGSVVATSSYNGQSYTLADGEEITFAAPVGYYLQITGENVAGTTTYSYIYDETGTIKLDEESVDGNNYTFETTFYGTNQYETIYVGYQPEMLAKAATEATQNVISSPIMLMSSNQPYVGETFDGWCWCSDISQTSGGMVLSIFFTGSSGVMAEIGTVSAYCMDHGDAPCWYGADLQYYATVTNIDYGSGTVWLNFTIQDGDCLVSDGYQRFGASGTIHRDFGGYIKVHKSSDCPNITEGNSNYSLAGAQYGIYSDYACTNLITTLTTDANGDTGTTGWLNTGTYYAKELVAPKGFEIDEDVHSVYVAGGTVTLEVTENSLNDPSYMWVGKIDREVNMNRPQGSGSLAGAYFQVRYYQQTDISTFEEAQSLTPTRTWVVATDEDGYADLDDSYKVSGDDFYYNQDGVVTIPLGTVTVEEIKAPDKGYLLNENAKYIQHITPDGTDHAIDVTYNAPIVPEQIIRGGISVSKTLVGGDNEELEGIGFAIISKTTGERMSWTDESGNTVDTLYLDKTGYASTKNDSLPYDTYQIVELEETVPEGIIWYGNSQTEFTQVVGEQTITENHAIYEQEVTDYKAPTMDLIKLDGDSVRDNGGDESKADRVAGSEWKLTYGDEVIFQGTTDENGELHFPKLEKFGTYTLTEVKAANQDKEDGYMSLEDAGEASSVSFTLDADTYEKILNGTYEGVSGDSWTFEMVDGTPAIVKTTANWKYRFIESIKTDQVSNEPVPNTRYQLYQYIGDEASYDDYAGIDRALTHDTYLTNPAEAIDASVWKLVNEGVTDENGSFISRGLGMHNYMLIEVQSAIEYAEWFESGDSTWDRYYFTTSQTSPQTQTQIYRNDKIELECDVDKSTIQRTSASFKSLENQNVNYNNVATEEYRYDVGFSNGETNHRADQYTVIDNCEFTSLGIRLTKFWTPVVQNDSDGTYNIWVKTAKGVTGGTASATATNPENLNADGTNRISTEGMLLWAENVDCATRQQLDVADLGLADDDYITEIMLEFGSVEVEFGTTTPMSYLVMSTYQLPADTVIPNSAESHITRNWNGGVDGYGLYDDDADSVETRVIDTMKYDSHTDDWYGTNGYAFGKSMPKTGDEFPVWIIGLALGTAFVAAGVMVVARRREKAENNS